MRCWPDSVLCSSVMFSWDKDNPPRGSCAAPGRDIPSALFLTEFRKKRSTFWCNAVLPLTKRHCPNGVGRSFGLAGPVARTCLILHFRPHPCGCVRKRRGLSHGLKTVHRTVFTAAKAAAGLSSPITQLLPDSALPPTPIRVRSEAQGTLPRAKKVSTGHFFARPMAGRSLRVPSTP